MASHTACTASPSAKLGVQAPLGQGDLDADGVLGGLRAIGYRGWLIVEQDTLPKTRERFEQAAADQRANRAFLRARGL